MSINGRNYQLSDNRLLSEKQQSTSSEMSSTITSRCSLKPYQVSLESIKSYYIYSNEIIVNKIRSLYSYCAWVFLNTLLSYRCFIAIKFIFHVFCIKYDIIINDSVQFRVVNQLL